MNYVPLNYEQVNGLTMSYLPSSVKTYNNVHFAYWERALFQRVISTLEFTLPDTWKRAQDFILYSLFKLGYMCVTDIDKYGLICQPCQVWGFDLYYQPTNARISNPYLQTNNEFIVGETCELLKLTPDFRGVWDIISYYAERLSLIDSAINMSLINSKFPWLLTAKNRSTAQALKKAYDKAQRGEPLIIFDRRVTSDDNGDSAFEFVDLMMGKERYIVTEQLEDLANIIRSFDTEIGIPTIPYEKKERLVTDEATSKQNEAIARITTWVETFNNSAEIVNEKYGTDISCTIRFENTEGVEENESSNNSID